MGKEKVVESRKKEAPNGEQDKNLPTPSQGGRSGGELARDIGTRDSLKKAKGVGVGVTRVRKSDEIGTED